MYGSRGPQGAQYYCREYGEKLPPDCHAQFHPACLKADKRRRTQERRQLEQERFLAWLARQKCPACGAPLKQNLKHGQREAPAAAKSPEAGRRAAYERRRLLTLLRNHFPVDLPKVGEPESTPETTQPSAAEDVFASIEGPASSPADFQPG